MTLCQYFIQLSSITLVRPNATNKILVVPMHKYFSRAPADFQYLPVTVAGLFAESRRCLFAAGSQERLGKECKGIDMYHTRSYTIR
jgi:hypothetical protein